MSNTIENRIAKYQAWRLRQPVDAPMIGLLWEPDIPPLPEFLDRVGIGAEVSADDIDSLGIPRPVSIAILRIRAMPGILGRRLPYLPGPLPPLRISHVPSSLAASAIVVSNRRPS
jgi:hypothetical protein